MNLHTFITGAQLAIRAGVAAALSLAIARLCGLEYPIYALLAAVIVTDLTPSQSRQLGLRRVVATIVGAICGATLTPILPSGPVAVASSIFVAMLICHVLHSQEGARVAGFICGIIVFDDSPQPWTYAAFRFVETVLGVGVAWLISCMPKLIRAREPGDRRSERQSH